MKFKHWLVLQESIHIQTSGGESYLGKSRDSLNGSEFSYAAGDYWSTFKIRPYAEYRNGYVNVSDGPATVIAVVKTTPIFPQNGADRAFIKSLTDALRRAGRTPIPYREGDNNWIGAVGSLEDFDGKDKIVQGLKGKEGFKSDEKAPAMGKSATGMTKVSSVSFNKESGSWAFIFRSTPGMAIMDVAMVEKIMKEAAKPMIDSDIMDFYQLVRGNNYGSAEVVYSSRGKKEQDDESDFEAKASAYMKFLAERMLANHPKARDKVISYVDHGKQTSRVSNVKPENTKIPLEELRKYITVYHSESPYLNFFVDVLQANRENMYEVFEDVSDTKDPEEAVRVYKSISGEDYDHMLESPLAFAYEALNVFRHEVILSRHARGLFEKFKREYESSLNDYVRDNPKRIGRKEIEYLKGLSEYIEVGAKSEVEELHKKMLTRDDEEKRKAEEKSARENDLMALGRFMYMKVGDALWKHMPDKYIDGDDVDIAELALGEEIVDREDISMAAAEKASEEASMDAEERKSLTYGQDKEEVESDIDYEWDEYLEDRFDQGEFENVPDEEAKEEIKRDHFDDFVAWKKERLEREEEEESWRYDPQPEESDIWKHEKDMAEKQAFEEGLVIFKWPDNDKNEIDVWVSSKNFDKARESVRKSLAISMSEKDEDGYPLVRKDQRVVFVLSDGDGKSEVRRMKAMEV